jgi:hypothetical protein
MADHTARLWFAGHLPSQCAADEPVRALDSGSSSPFTDVLHTTWSQSVLLTQDGKVVLYPPGPESEPNPYPFLKKPDRSRWLGVKEPLSASHSRTDRFIGADSVLAYTNDYNLVHTLHGMLEDDLPHESSISTSAWPRVVVNWQGYILALTHGGV